MPSVKVPVMPCPTCQTEGYIALSDGLEFTLNEVVSTPWVSASELLDRHTGISVTAINNRLEHLRELGFLIRQRRGKSWIYRATLKKNWPMA